jgi:fatty acid amide hydrolase
MAFAGVSGFDILVFLPPLTKATRSMSPVLLSHSARQLVAEMSAGRVSAVDLLEACRQRVAEVNPALNALVVPRWDAALEEARQADQAQRVGQPLGPLHGLPMTIKEMFDVAGLPTTAGIERRRALRVTRDAETVRRLRQAGAIVIGKTNVPQLGMMAESDNPVYGRTNNPWNLERGPGGSSGGEAALIAAGASPLGLGSDGGGSIRQPSHVCGICGFKPTGGRLPLRGHWLANNWPADWVQPGPMGRHVEDLQLAFGVLCGRPDRPTVYAEVPLAAVERSIESLRGLRVGMYQQLDELPAGPTVQRAVREAAAALESSGMEIVPYELDRVAAMWDVYLSLFYADGLCEMRHLTRGSAIDRHVRRCFQLARLPRWSRCPAAWIVEWLGQPHMAQVLRTLRRPVLTAQQYTSLVAQMHGLRHHFGVRMKRQRIDLLLGPAGPVPAFPHGEFYANASFIYTGIFNLLAVPAGVVPATRVRADELPSQPPPRDLTDRALWRSQAGSQGLPVGVQVVGRWWADDQVLAVMKLLEQQLSQSPEYPRGPEANVKR